MGILNKVLNTIGVKYFNPVQFSSLEEIIENSQEEWSCFRKNCDSNTRILIATSLGGYNHAVVLESVLAIALTMRGAKVEILLCNEFLPACQLTKIQKISPEKLVQNGQLNICHNCYSNGFKVFQPLGLPIHFLGNFVTEKNKQTAKNYSKSISLAKIGRYTYQGISVGEHAMAGALRYFARGDLKNVPFAEPILRKYLEASFLTVFSLQKLVNNFHHGIYVPQGLIGDVCRNNNVRVINWNPAYRKNTFIFSHHDSYHHTMITEPQTLWKSLKWNNKIERKTVNYLKSRWRGKSDWISFQNKPVFDKNQIENMTRIDFTKPCIGMLTSVLWDAQLHYKSNAFKSMKDWVFKTISYFSKRKDLQLIVRIHPAEISGMIPSQQRIADEILTKFPILPQNVFLIKPESHISTYAISKLCDSVLIYNTKTGIEISSMGIPVIVAGEAWIRNKGFSYDATNQKEYFSLLNRLPFGFQLDPEKIVNAKKYAFHYFFRRMIPLPFITSPKRFIFALKLSNLSELRPGNFPGLDVICEGILKEKQFIYKEENYLH